MNHHLTAIIADDEEHLREFLVTKLAQFWPELTIVAQCINGIEAEHAIAQFRPTIAFLDIKMPGKTGLEVAQQSSPATRIVFVTAFDQFAIAAFENEAVDYLLKPVADDRLKATITRLQRAVAPAGEAQNVEAPNIAVILAALQQSVKPKAPEYLRWIRASRGATPFQIPVEDILFFKSDDKYTIVQTAGAEHLIRSTLTELINQLDPTIFWQIHRSTVVHANRVIAAMRDELGNMEIQVQGYERPLQVSRAFQTKFKPM